VTEAAAFSRRMLAFARSKQPSHQEESARRFLQKRLELYARIVFWAFVALRVMELLLYWAVPDVKPMHYPYIVALGVAGLAVMAACWRGLLVRRTLSLRALGVVDATYTLSAGLVFAGTALLAPNRQEVGYVCLVYTCFVVFMRALVVPSTGRFTLATSLFALGPIVIAALVLALTTDQAIPGPAYFGGAFAFSGFAVAIASAGSRLIYGLRKRVDEQMQLGQYTLEAKLGRDGGIGDVYRARHLLLRRPTAMKLLHPDRVGADTLLRFEREVQHMSELTHPNTVVVFDYGYSPDGIFYYEMEYLDGVDLETLVATDGPQHPGRVVRILIQICGALHEAHGRRMFHRDIKPRNIMLCRRGGMPDFVKVLNFGLTTDEKADASAATDIQGLGKLAHLLLGEGRVIPERLASIVNDCVAGRPTSVLAIADQLHALQLDTTWTDEEARAWWDAHDAAPSGRHSIPSMTIEVDLDEMGSRDDHASTQVSSR
jgi:serine/threonine-protein kinase